MKRAPGFGSQPYQYRFGESSAGSRPRPSFRVFAGPRPSADEVARADASFRRDVQTKHTFLFGRIGVTGGVGIVENKGAE